MKKFIISNFKSKKILVPIGITFLLGLSYIFMLYVNLESGNSDIETMLLPQNLAFNTLNEIFTTIYWLPLILIAVFHMSDDISDKFIYYIKVSNKKYKYLLSKILSLFVISILIIFSFFILYTTIALLLPNIDKSNFNKIISLNTLISLLLYAIILFLFFLVALTVLVFTKNNILSSFGVMFYIFIERIYTFQFSFAIAKPFIFKLNEFLLWANSNSILIHSHQIGLQNVNIANGSSPTMLRFEIIEGFNTITPYLKSLPNLLFVLIIQFIIITILLNLSYRKLFKNMK